MISDTIKPTGLVSFVLTDEFGNVKRQEEHNLVVNTGLAFLTSRAVGTAQGVMSHMAVGTGSAAAAGTQAVLTTESARVALGTPTTITTSVTNDTIQYSAIFSAGTGTGTLTEAGIFNAASAGTMLARTVFASSIGKAALDTLTITWTIKLAGV